MYVTIAGLYERANPFFQGNIMSLVGLFVFHGKEFGLFSWQTYTGKLFHSDC